MLDQILIEVVATAIFIFVVFLTKHYAWIGLITAIIIYVSNGKSMFNPAIAVMNYVNGTYSLLTMGWLILAELVGALIGFQLYRMVK